MAVKTYYFKNAVPSGATLHRSLQDGGSAPSTATSTTGWVVSDKATGQACLQTGGSEVTRASGTWGTTLRPSAAPSQTVGDCWRSENLINGNFANANWTFTFGIRSVTAAYTGRLKLALRIWKTSNANGTSAIELTSGRITSAATSANLSTSADTTVTITFSPGQINTFVGEYLFVSLGVEVTSAGGGTTQDMDFRVGSAYTLATSDFTQLSMPADVSSFAMTGNDAGLTQTFARRAQVQWASLQVPTAHDRSIAADVASFAETGNAAGLIHASTMPAAVVTFTETANAAGLAAGRMVAAVVTTFAETGNAAGLTHAVVLPADVVAFTLTGNNAGLTKTGSYSVAAAVASFSLTANDAALPHVSTMPATTASFAETGNAAGLAYGAGLPAITATFTLTGVAAGLTQGGASRIGRVLWASLQVPRSSAGQRIGRVHWASLQLPHTLWTLAADPASFALTGNATRLASGFALQALTATYVETGNATGVLKGWVIPAAAVAFAETGNAAGLPVGRSVPATTAAFTLTGNAANLALSTRVMSASTATYSFVAPDVPLSVGGTFSVDVFWEDVTGEDAYRVKWGTISGAYSDSIDLAAGSTSYTIQGLANHTTYFWTVVALVADVEQDPAIEGVFTVGVDPLPADVATFTLTGSASTFPRGYAVPADVTAFALVGNGANLVTINDFAMPADAVSFALTGQAAGLSRGLSLTTNAVVFDWAVTAAGLAHMGQTLLADQQFYTLVGIDAALGMPKTMSATVCPFDLTGLDGFLTKQAVMAADATTFAVLAPDVTFTAKNILTAQKATYALTGNDVQFGTPPPIPPVFFANPRHQFTVRPMQSSPRILRVRRPRLG